MQVRALSSADEFLRDVSFAQEVYRHHPQ